MFEAGQSNFTFNSTFNITEDDLPDFGLSIYMYPNRFPSGRARQLRTVAEDLYLVTNKIWLRFVADPDYAG